jgi:hypothetical protein
LAIDFAHFIASPNQPQIVQNPATPGQRKSKKKAWISLDSLGGNEPFQGVIVTPQGKKSFLAPFLRNCPSHSRAFVPEHPPR